MVNKIIKDDNMVDVDSILKHQKSLSDFTKDLTVFLTDEHLSNFGVLKQYRDKELKELIKDKRVSAFGKLIQADEFNNKTLKEFVSTFRENCLDIFQDDKYKKRYTQQLVVGMARLEGVPENIIDKIYGENMYINKDMQDVFKKNNLTLMDLTSRDVIFGQKEKQLFLYTMLFLHDGEDKNTDKARESGYYKVKEGAIEIKEYGIKSFEQAFNCGWQIYNDFFGNKEEKKHFPYYSINSVEDIYGLYDPNTSIDYNGKKIDSHTLAGILNITRALLHIQAHKHLDYIRGEIHDPESFVKYKKGKSWKEIYGTQIDEVRDWEIAALWRDEISCLEIKDTAGNNIKERSPMFYSADTKSWHLQSIEFNNVETSFSGRSKGLTSWVMKLINDPKYKKGKDVTDSLGNSFYVNNKQDGLKVWLGLIEKLPEKLIDGARLDIKGSSCWEILVNEISKDGILLPINEIKQNLSKYGISDDKIDLLLRNKSFRGNLNEKLNNINELKNIKTVEGYEEFKIVTTTGTEYQISEKKNNLMFSNNELGLGNHGIYNIKKLMELLLRPNNHTMVLGHDTIENIINNALDEEEFYLKERAKKIGIINNHNITKFNPRNAISNQLVYDDFIKNKSDIDTSLLNNIKEDREDLFKGNKENSRSAVKEFIYNMIQKEYIGYLKNNGTYLLSKPLGNQRSIVSQLNGYKIYKKLPKESS